MIALAAVWRAGVVHLPQAWEAAVGGWLLLLEVCWRE